jgi:hypothetical protein
LSDQLDPGLSQDAAQQLLVVDTARRPGHAWQLGGWLQDQGVVEWDGRLAALLGAQVDHADDPLWWTVLTDQLAPITPAPSVDLLPPAARRAVHQHGVGWLQQRLATLRTRVDVEGPPWAREAWRVAVADCAVKYHIAVADLGLPDHLHPDRRPIRSWMRGTGEDERDAFLAAHNTVEALLADAPEANLADLRSEWVEAVDLVADRMDLGQVEQAAAIFSRAGSNRLSIHVRLGRRALDLGASDVAWKLAEGVVAQAGARSWQRTWDGGSLLSALGLLAELDPDGTRDRAYRRFAADAASDRFLLSEVASDLRQYLQLFGIDDADALGEEAEHYLRVLLHDPETQPSGDLDEETGDAATTLARTGIDLLGIPPRLAVTTAQRALLEALQAGDYRVQTLLVRALQSQDEELVLRILSVLEAALEIGAPLGEEVADALQRWTAAEHLGLRLASRRLTGRLGHTPEPISPRALPAAYRIVMPEPEQPPGMRLAEPLGRDDLEVITTLVEGGLQGLARAAGVDHQTLIARVASLARSLAGDKLVDDDRWRTSSSPLGWTFHKPSISLWEQAAARVAAELADAGRLTPEHALLLSTGPGYDPTLIAARPTLRPKAVAPLPERSDGPTSGSDRWLEALDGAEDRLARTLPGGWLVIGEHTELRPLDHEGPREHRTQTLGALARLRPDDQIKRRQRTPIATIGDGPTTDATPLLCHWDSRFRGPSAWLVLHPRLARACGWTRDNDALAGWLDDDGPVVSSLWWRSGWLDSTSWADHQEVGEGWLVLAQERALNRLAEALDGQPGVAWQVKRDYLAEGRSSDRRFGLRRPQDWL